MRSQSVCSKRPAQYHSRPTTRSVDHTWDRLSAPSLTTFPAAEWLHPHQCKQWKVGHSAGCPADILGVGCVVALVCTTLLAWALGLARSYSPEALPPQVCFAYAGRLASKVPGRVAP